MLCLISNRLILLTSLTISTFANKVLAQRGCGPVLCGISAICTEIGNRPICSCPKGYEGNPLIHCHAKPDCSDEIDCPPGFLCREGRCVHRCVGACGTNADCMLRGVTPICSCPEGFIGDPFQSCRPSNSTHSICSPGTCGSSALCKESMVEDRPRPICFCPRGYVGNPLVRCSKPDDDIECLGDSECFSGSLCIKRRCVDDCTDLCGTNAECRIRGRTPICSCPEGYIGDPFQSCRPSNSNSTDLCHPNPCGENTKCEIINNKPTCSCLNGYEGNPLSGCRPDLCHPNPCGENTKCEIINNKPTCSCLNGYEGNPLSGCRLQTTTSLPVATSSGCLIPTGNILVTEMATKQKLQGGELAKEGTSIKYSCSRKYTLIGSANNLCNGNWENTHPECKKTCPPIDDRTIEARCFYGGNQVNCNNPIEPGTAAKIKCGALYSKPRNRLVYEDIYCQSDGEWDHEPFKCEQICGTVNTNFAYSVGSKVTEPNNVPWHVAIYRKQDSSDYKLICGGTLIQSKIIISAAHCFWDSSESVVYDKSKFIVASGKFYSDYDANEALEVQRLNVSKIDIPQTFSGYLYDFANDIAVLTLTNHIKYGNHVSPACLTWREESDQYIQSNLSGVVAGWGNTETGTSSPELRSVKLLSVDNYTCKRKKISKFDKIASDKFCVETSGGKNVCAGDSGGGFVVAEMVDDIIFYNLWGVVSNGIIPMGSDTSDCNENFTTTFTNVQFYKYLINNAIIKAY